MDYHLFLICSANVFIFILKSVLPCTFRNVDIYLFSHRVMDLGRMALDLEKETNKVGLKINTNKIRILNSKDDDTFPQNASTMIIYLLTH